MVFYKDYPFNSLNFQELITYDYVRKIKNNYDQHRFVNISWHKHFNGTNPAGFGFFEAY